MAEPCFLCQQAVLVDVFHGVCDQPQEEVNLKKDAQDGEAGNDEEEKCAKENDVNSLNFLAFVICIFSCLLCR